MAHSFRDADHLPNNRESGDPPDPAGLPRQRAGRTPQMHGRYPDFDVMALAPHWDDVTRSAIEERERQTPEIRFFDPGEVRTLDAFLDVVLAQDSEPRVPVLNMVDAKFHAGTMDGYRYADMPPDDQTYRVVARGLDYSAGEGGFAAADFETQRSIVSGFSEGSLSGGPWEELELSTAWSVVMRVALSEFYSHPWAWNEIGFRGPAYPRGYMRRNMGPSGADPDEPIEAYGLDPVADLGSSS